MAADRPSRLSYGAVAAGIGGLLLILSLFLDWVGSFGGGANAFALFSIVDFVLLILGIAAVAFAAIEALGVDVNLPFDRVRALTVIGIVVASIVLTFLFEADGIKIGLILATIGALSVLAGGILAERSPQLGVANPAASVGSGGQPPTPAPLPGAAGAPPAGTAAAPAPAPAPAPAATPAPAAAVKADWYPDPRGEKRLRYWDGSAWTDHTAD